MSIPNDTKTELSVSLEAFTNKVHEILESAKNKLNESFQYITKILDNIPAKSQTFTRAHWTEVSAILRKEFTVAKNTDEFPNAINRKFDSILKGPRKKSKRSLREMKKDIGKFPDTANTIVKEPLDDG
ncbi:uncharacterized protein EAE97_012195 [Botrytis byssoidea]|uniref:Uncharacterized protein n=1 Tax=Botrytis byssoidea TaxID=139641 RepID=A0A9P5HNU0_9HELO|nr:uncharacterized protein EAE97_012195 [Botrytis byssoidea]KAF7915556.1 hypothetical protein EAE97_012195 [Botrytis byssoidea]